jgi:ABC-2 type transport system permease protein
VKHVPTVAWRELRSLFVSPVAYAVMSLFAVLSGLFFVIHVVAFLKDIERRAMFGQTTDVLNLSDHLIGPFLGSMDVVLWFLVPAVTMGLFAAEKTNGTQELLLTSPLTVWDIVLGKFAAGAAFIAILVAMLAAFPGLLFAFGDPEIGKTVSAVLATLLAGWT